MSKYAAFLSFVTIDASNKTIRFVEGSTTTNVTLAEGSYPLRGDGTADDLCKILKTAFESNADAANNTYTVSVAMSVDPSAPTAVVTITRATGAGNFSILWAHANTTFDPLLIGHEALNTAHNGTAKAGTLSPTALWVSSDFIAESEPEEEYDVTVHETEDGRLLAARKGGAFEVRRVSFLHVDDLRVHDESNLDDPAAAFMTFHELVGDGRPFEMHEQTLSSGMTLDDLSSSTRIGTAWHFDEETAAEFAPERIEPGVPMYAFQLRLCAGAA